MSTREAFLEKWLKFKKSYNCAGVPSLVSFEAGWQVAMESQWQSSEKAFMHKETGELRRVLNSDDHKFDEWQEICIIEQPPKEKL
jgi:hypothetical protein